MEFEDDAPITDEQRHLAEARQLNIQPLDPSVRPEEFSEEHQAAEHLRGPAIANAPNDVEQDSPSLQPTPSLVSPTATKKAPSLRSVRAGMVGAIVFLAAAIAAIILYTLN
jgi:hypothetical protein